MKISTINLVDADPIEIEEDEKITRRPRNGKSNTKNF